MSGGTTKTGRRVMIALCISCAVVIGGFVYILTRPPRDPWFSPADAPRPWAEEEWRRVMQPVEVQPPPYTGWFDEVKTEREGDKLRLSVPSAHNIRYEPPYETRSFDEAFEFKEGGGSFRLEYIATTWPAAEPDQNHQVPLNYFHPDGRPLTEEELGASELQNRERTTSFEYHQGPAVKFGIRVEGFEDFQPKTLRLLDARTHFNVGGGTSLSWPGPEGSMRWSADILAWHPAPVIAALDFACGPSYEETIPAKVGARFKREGIVCQILAIEPGEETGWSSSFGSEAEGGRIEIRFKEEGSAAQHVIVMGVHPSPFAAGISVEAVNAAGESLQSHGSGSADMILVQEYAAPLDQLAGVRVKLRSKYRRVIAEFDELPGLPEFNRGVKNLFDVKIPYIRFPYQSSMEEAIRGGAQLQSQVTRSPISPTPPPNYFPKVMRDATLREIAEEYRQTFYPKTKPWIDVQKGELHLDQPKGFRQTIRDAYSQARWEWRRSRQQVVVNPQSAPATPAAPVAPAPGSPAAPSLPAAPGQ